jgi:hypothetical protein
MPTMSEPASSAAAGAVGWKLIGGLAGIGSLAAALAFFFVWCMNPPKSRKEMALTLASTLISSACGCAGLVKYWGIEQWVHDGFGLLALGGLFFACGLPGWALVKMVFTTLERRKDKDLVEIADEVRRQLKDVAP